MVTDLVGMCLDEHVQVMSRKACQKRKDIIHTMGGRTVHFLGA